MKKMMKKSVLIGSLVLGLAANCSKSKNSDSPATATPTPTPNLINNGNNNNQQNPQGGIVVSGVRKFLSTDFYNGFMQESYALFVFQTTTPNVTAKKVTVNGVEIKTGSQILGDASVYLNGLINQEAVNRFAIDEEQKQDLLATAQSQPFYYIEGFSLDMSEGTAGYNFVFSLETSQGQRLEYPVKMDNVQVDNGENGQPDADNTGDDNWWM
jgi:hypothetical protein